jgi:hypothetical protein
MSKIEAEAEKNRLNWDNNFSIRFKLANGKSLEKIPNNLFAIELPEITTTDMSDEVLNKSIGITLRSAQDGTVEKELFDILFRTYFDIELSLSNPNKVDYVYKSCSVEKLTFSPLMNRPKANPFNLTVWAKVSQIVFKGTSEEIAFGGTIKNQYDVIIEDEEGESVNGK